MSVTIKQTEGVTFGSIEDGGEGGFIFGGEVYIKLSSHEVINLNNWERSDFRNKLAIVLPVDITITATYPAQPSPSH